MTPPAANSLVESVRHEVISRQLAYFDYERGIMKMTSPGGRLRYRIENDLPAPECYVDPKKAEAKRNEERERERKREAARLSEMRELHTKGPFQRARSVYKWNLGNRKAVPGPGDTDRFSRLELWHECYETEVGKSL